ncbi:MAG: hypothetical protein KatS3mg062_0564 [Tepidiforma sp.]|nr:MAG: hypothetical protein KatS3mg062_0564 [Tepidiforma sp.]
MSGPAKRYDRSVRDYVGSATTETAAADLHRLPD